jgi:hypothetical protein
MAQYACGVGMDFHAKQDATIPFSAIRCEIHLERTNPPDPVWIGYDGPENETAQTIWEWYNMRQPIEPAFRFRRQHLFWTRLGRQRLLDSLVLPVT